MGITQANTLGIQGLGGVGKSTLAAYFYHSLDFAIKFWADVSQKPDFTVFAEKIILALGGKVTQPIDITELINNLLQLLSQRRCLLVVDNLETLLDEERNWQDEYYQQFFSRWQQQKTTSTLFITTQDKPQLFQGLQHWYALGGMKIEEGIALLNNLKIQGTETELNAFVEYVDGHPLTIKLVGGFLKEYCDNRLSKAKKEFKLKQFELVYQQPSGFYRDKTKLKPQNALLSWIIQQHLTRLNSEQKQFLTNLSVYRLPFNREAASYISIVEEVKPIVIQKKLQELCNRSLLVKTQDNKFQFESLVQKYVLQQANDLTYAHQQAIEYYKANFKLENHWQNLADITEYLEIVDHYHKLKLYSKANNILKICLRFMDLQGYHLSIVENYEKLVQGWQTKLQSQDLSDYAWALTILGIHTHYLGNSNQSLKSLNLSLEIFIKIKDGIGLVSSLSGLGDVYDSLGNYHQAINRYQKALDISHQIINVYEEGRFLEAGSLNGLGNAYFSLGDYGKAINLYQKALDISQELNYLNLQPGFLNSLGNAYYSIGEYKRSIEFHEKALTLSEISEDRNQKSLFLNNLGNTCNAIGEYQQAINYLQESLNIVRETGNRNGEALSLMNLGNTYTSLGEYQRAISYFQQSLEIQQHIKDSNGESSSLNNLSNVYNALGEYQKAINCLQESLNIARRIGNRKLESLSLNNLGNAYYLMKEHQQAMNFYQKSLDISGQIGIFYEKANSLANIGVIYISLKEYRKAIDYLQEALKIQQEIGNSIAEAKSLANIGTAYHYLQKDQLAIKFYKKALTISQNIGDRRGEANTWFNLGDTQKYLQQNSEAKVAYEKAQKLYEAMKLCNDVEDCNKAIQDLENQTKD